jgi:hypothetical protein
LPEQRNFYQRLLFNFQNAIPGLPPSTGEAGLTKDKQEESNKPK